MRAIWIILCCVLVVLVHARTVNYAASDLDILNPERGFYAGTGSSCFCSMTDLCVGGAAQ